MDGKFIYSLHCVCPMYVYTQHQIAHILAVKPLGCPGWLCYMLHVIPSIGEAISAVQPQPARLTYKTSTTNQRPWRDVLSRSSCEFSCMPVAPCLQHHVDTRTGVCLWQCAPLFPSTLLLCDVVSPSLPTV